MSHLRDVSVAPSPTAGVSRRSTPRALVPVLVAVALLLALNAVLLLDQPQAVPPAAAPSQGPAVASGPCTTFAGPTGDDSAPGTRDEPLGTVEALVEGLSDDETGCLLTGTYEADKDISIEEDGVTLRSAPGQRATLSVGTLFIQAGASDVTVSDLEIIGGSEDVTVRAIGDRFTITRNDITNRNEGLSCILVGSQESSADAGTILGNAVHDCGRLGDTLDHAIYAQNFGPEPTGGVGLLIAYNALYGHAGYGIQLFPEGRGAVVRDNVVDGTGATRGGIVIDGEVAEDYVVERNIITGTATNAIEQRTGNGHVIRKNCSVDNDGDVDADNAEVSDNVTSRDPRYDVCVQVLGQPWREVGDLALGAPLLPW